MKFIQAGNNTKALESSVKNKWHWVWLEDKNGEGTPWNEWCKKIDTPRLMFLCPLWENSIIHLKWENSQQINTCSIAVSIFSQFSFRIMLSFLSSLKGL